MAIPDVSSALLEQLKPGGRLIAPIGPGDSPQQLILFQKGPDGRVTETEIMEVIFRSLPGGTRL
jgi:protein-L-isoaspartate(D-aspartate) O-methyltransferase